MKVHRRAGLAWIAAAALLLGLLVGSLPGSPPGALPGQADGLARRRSAVVEVFESAKDAVVNISSTHVVKVQSPFGLGLFEDFFPGQHQQRVRQYTSVGSGFVIHPDGYLVTNAHVVARTAERRAIFTDQTELEAQIIAIDEERDLAILKVDPPRPLKPLNMGTSADLMVGETVIAIGNPLGYQNTVTAGVISALDREIAVNQNLSIKGLIQTDASINPGNSGGPLLNVLGELVGINTAIRGDAQNIGFAIPVDALRQTLPDLLDVERRYRIVTGMRVSADARSRVVRVDEESPAHRAGIEVGDTLVSMDGQALGSGIDYYVGLIGRHDGERIPLRLLRDGRTIDTVLTPQRRPKPDGAKLLLARFGIEAVVITPELARQLELSPRVTGLLVTGIESRSPAAAVRFQRRDIITALGRYEVASLDDVGELLEQIQPGQQVAMTVLRLARGAIIRQRVAIEAR